MRNRYYEWIEDQFSLLNLDSQDYLVLQDIDLPKTGLLELMVLEKSGYLGALKQTPLKTWFFPGEKMPSGLSNDPDNRQEHVAPEYLSTILLGNQSPQGSSFPQNHLPPANSFLIQIHKELQALFPAAILDNPKPPLLKNEAFIPHCAFYITDKALEHCIKSSSPYIAAGDLSNMSMLQLITLQQSLLLYGSYDYHLDKVVNCLIPRIHSFLQEKFTQFAIQFCQQTIQNKFLAQQKKATQELHFKIAFQALLSEVTILSGKGNSHILIPCAPAGKGGFISIESKQYNPVFKPIGLTCAYLETALLRLKKELMQKKLQLSDFTLIATTCKHELERVKTNFEGFAVEWANLNDKVAFLGTLLDELKLHHQQIESCNADLSQRPNAFFQGESASVEEPRQVVKIERCVIS